MVISPRSKIVTLSLLIGIITLVALIITGVIGIWSGKSEKTNTATGTKMVSSKLQQVTGYAAMQHVSKVMSIGFAKRRDHTRNVDNDNSLSRKINASWNLTLSNSDLPFRVRCPFSYINLNLRISFILGLRYWHYYTDYISRTHRTFSAVRMLEICFFNSNKFNRNLFYT